MWREARVWVGKGGEYVFFESFFKQCLDLARPLQRVGVTFVAEIFDNSISFMRRAVTRCTY